MHPAEPAVAMTAAAILLAVALVAIVLPASQATRHALDDQLRGRAGA